jgi:hypothetical protein
VSWYQLHVQECHEKENSEIEPDLTIELEQPGFGGKGEVEEALLAFPEAIPGLIKQPQLATHPEHSDRD